MKAIKANAVPVVCFALIALLSGCGSGSKNNGIGTCNFDMAGAKCAFPQVKASCCDAYKIALKCAEDHPYDQDEVESCVKKDPRYLQLGKDAGGSCPGIQKAMASDNILQYCGGGDAVESCHVETRGVSCDFPEVKTSCCNLFKISLRCQEENPGDQYAQQKCLENAENVKRDQVASGGTCPGIKAAMTNMETHPGQYCTGQAVAFEEFQLGEEPKMQPTQKNYYKKQFELAVAVMGLAAPTNPDQTPLLAAGSLGFAAGTAFVLLAVRIFRNRQTSHDKALLG